MARLSLVALTLLFIVGLLGLASALRSAAAAKAEADAIRAARAWVLSQIADPDPEWTWLTYAERKGERWYIAGLVQPTGREKILYDVVLSADRLTIEHGEVGAEPRLPFAPRPIFLPIRPR